VNPKNARKNVSMEIVTIKLVIAYVVQVTEKMIVQKKFVKMIAIIMYKIKPFFYSNV
jgi:hypothetical protein